MLELTDNDGQSIWVNMHRALCFYKCEVNGKKRTRIYFGNEEELFVKETPESIGERLLKIMIYGCK